MRSSPRTTRHGEGAPTERGDGGTNRPLRHPARRHAGRLGRAALRHGLGAPEGDAGHHRDRGRPGPGGAGHRGAQPVRRGPLFGAAAAANAAVAVFWLAVEGPHSVSDGVPPASAWRCRASPSWWVVALPSAPPGQHLVVGDVGLRLAASRRRRRPDHRRPLRHDGRPRHADRGGAQGRRSSGERPPAWPRRRRSRCRARTPRRSPSTLAGNDERAVGERQVGAARPGGPGRAHRAARPVVPGRRCATRPWPRPRRPA